MRYIGIDLHTTQLTICYLDTDGGEQFEEAKIDRVAEFVNIVSKYIIVNDTSNQAVMFLPAEAIFAQINASHGNLIDYAQKRNVWLASPTTLMAMLTTIQVVIKNLEQAKHAKVIQEHLAKLSDEFTHYKFRWNNLAKHIDTAS